MNTALSVSSIIGAILGAGTVVFALTYFFTQAKTGNNKKQLDVNDSLQKANESLNDTLNQLMSAQEKKINNLQDAHVESQRQIGELRGRVDELSKKNGDLEHIINTALDRYFTAHPEEAMKLASLQLPSNDKK